DHPDWWTPVGGQNSQDSILERRSVVYNDDRDMDPADQERAAANYAHSGKFFPRGMRGMIERIEILCQGAVVDGLELGYGIHPSLGPIGTFTLTPLVALTWQGADINLMWDYDSLWIWVISIEPGVLWTFDRFQPYDGHTSVDAGVTWVAQALRPFISVTYSGETPGDVPVSGIINNIAIPSSSSRSPSIGKAIPITDWTDCIRIEAVGFEDFIIVQVREAASSHTTEIRVYCDGVVAFNFQFFDLNALGFVATTPSVSLPTYGEDEKCVMLIHRLFHFRRNFTIQARNLVGAQIVDVWAFTHVLR
ncbi:unnamed protein product, partial [marine sediment metagenome]